MQRTATVPGKLSFSQEKTGGGFDMGQEVDKHHFHKHDFSLFKHNLRVETELLHYHFARHTLSKRSAIAGFELEACLINRAGQPSAGNKALVQQCRRSEQQSANKEASPEVSAELSLFNLEINTRPQSFHGDALDDIHAQLRQRWQFCQIEAQKLDMNLLLIGILPSLTPAHLTMDNMSPLKRYQALNEQVLRLRRGKPLHIDIDGIQHLISEHANVMIEAATTSFQIHWQVMPATAHRYYNAMLIASAPLVSASANSPLLFGKTLWQESRIPLFEQSIAVNDGSPGNRLARVTFGSAYTEQSLLECFDENLAEYAVMLPSVSDSDPAQLKHLQLHNGTVWRWLRPIVGFDNDGTPHLRLEQRICPAGPTLIDSVANAALLFGLSFVLAESDQRPEHKLDFSRTRNNFYSCARHGLQSSIDWIDGKQHKLPDLFRQQLLPMAKEGLSSLNCSGFEPYLAIIAERVASGRNGAWWQLEHFRRHQNLTKLTLDYYQQQISDRPVHSWSL
ncbi:MAG: glutamate--cysteine ligase [Zetaproteobacteria bacterium CG_4_9_14_3_um_filter_49_83]|nr:MAG: glutamate--cysteine ligase [Zetaproteobacteria bacterium CG17_big_fil_post_rev_8_21_14_2_50_50_13]PIV29762.1 MAG: glutamate--cysteine ligase [Zetaproteobacteria bacterium CG02_land_8_20_14_3_00_50_9]PIY54928.1 MAG: glutamate--cysteine ligase [Zetaproteobacteria bacterium CG_4_10_14_0_8_um_filter_49_80]PJA35270.1 MAG: glutamate--cysteine ligase [Zetaproteobacteria bacterium CG_4_9_14_3_um_filter_49_83]